MDPDKRLYGIYDLAFARRGRTEPDLKRVMSDPRSYAVPRPWWPAAKDAAILDAGCGNGEELLNSWAGGYRNLTGVDISSRQAETARRCLPPEVKVEHADVIDYLRPRSGAFDLIVCFDLIEHFVTEGALELLDLIHAALRPGGSCVIRTVNMACVLGGFCRYIDATHKAAFTEFSLMQLLDAAGFRGHRVMTSSPLKPLALWRPWRSWRGFGMRKRALKLMNHVLHEMLYRLMGHRGSSIYEPNMTVQTFKPD